MVELIDDHHPRASPLTVLSRSRTNRILGFLYSDQRMDNNSIHHPLVEVIHWHSASRIYIPHRRLNNRDGAILNIV